MGILPHGASSDRSVVRPCGRWTFADEVAICTCRAQTPSADGCRTPHDSTTPWRPTGPRRRFQTERRCSSGSADRAHGQPALGRLSAGAYFNAPRRRMASSPNASAVTRKRRAPMSTRTRLTLAVAGACAVIAIIGVLADRAYTVRSMASTREMLASLATSHAKQIAAEVRERVADARLVGVRDATQHALDTTLHADYRTSETLLLSRALDWTAATYNLRHLIVLDRQLRPVARAATAPHPTDTLRADVGKAISQRRAVVLGVRQDADSTVEWDV